MTTEAQQSDRIERSIVINASRDKVWRSLTHAETFGTWFGAELAGQVFEPGRRVRGRIAICGFEHVFFDVVVDRIEPQQRFSFHWHPYPVDPKVDYTLEQPTRVEFTLADAPDSATLLKVVESGFDGVPPHRRFEAFRMNNQGWQAQLLNIANYAQQQ